MEKHSKPLLQNLHKLNNINLDTHTPYQALTTLLVEDNQPSNDAQILALIEQINQKFSLNETDAVLYQKQPLTFMGKGTIIGLHNHKLATYRLIRAEHYPEYTLLCKGLDKIGLTMFIIHDSYLDAIFGQK